MSALLFLLGVFTAAVVAWLVNRLAPDIFARLFPQPPVHVHVETDPAIIYAGAPNWVGSGWVIPGAHDPVELGPAPTDVCRDWRSWMKPRGAYDGWETELKITLVGASPATVVLDDLRVKTISRREPTGIALNCLVGGADITPRSLVVDLDFEPGVVTYEDDGGEPAGSFAFSLAKGEVER